MDKKREEKMPPGTSSIGFVNNKDGSVPDMSKGQGTAETVVNLHDPATTIKGIKLNIGSGVDCKDGYVNVDKYDSSADIKADICNLPFHDNSVAVVTCMEVLEHLGINEIGTALKELHRVMKPGASLHATVPDIVDACKKLVEDPENDWTLAVIYGNQTHDGQYHKNGFTPKRIFKLLGYAGFRIIKTAYIENLNVRNIYIEAVK